MRYKNKVGRFLQKSKQTNKQNPQSTESPSGLPEFTEFNKNLVSNKNSSTKTD